MEDVQIEVVEHFKYIGSLQSADGKNNVTMTPNPELEWPRKECSIWYRSGETEDCTQRADNSNYNNMRALVGEDGSHVDPLRHRKVHSDES